MYRVIIAVLAVSLLGASCNKDEVVIHGQYEDGLVHLANRSISVDIAGTTDEQRRGLSGRESIEDNQGMLFVFQVPDFPTFWMKDMKIPIDIIWIKHDEVVDISSEVQAEPGVKDSDLKTYSPKQPADKVLELKAGWAARNSLKIGDKVEVIRIVQ